MSFTRIIKRAIDDSGQTLYAISQGAGLAYGSLHTFYHEGRDIRISTLEKLADYLGLELSFKREGSK